MSFYPTLCIVFVIVLLQTCLSETMSETIVVQSANGFALEMYRKMAESPGNVIFSPISIFIALSMTSLGAKENTLKEIRKSLKVEYDKDVVHSWCKSFRQRMMNGKDKRDYTFSLANRLFGEKSYTFLDKFLQDTSKYYSANLEHMDFKEKYEESRRHINDWVSNVTHNKIKELLATGVLNSATRLVLVNAIYFKGDWLSKFSANKTIESDYYVTKTEVISVRLMHEKLYVSHGYSAALQSEVLELPYKGDSLSMLVLLPNLQYTTLAHLEYSLTPSALSSLRLHNRKMDVWLPKFKIESSFNLNKQLKQMGMADLFSAGKADLSGMDGSKDLYVSSVVHKAFVEVNEEGSEAAAATGAGVRNHSIETILEFKANHPFLFYVRENRSNSILFFGKFIKP